MKTWKKILIGAGSVLLVLAGIIGFSLVSMINGTEEKVSQIALNAVDLNQVADGTYEGSCDVGAIYAKVSVVVSDHTIKSIDLIEHKNGKGKPAEVLSSIIQEKQSLEVDNISGATASSKVIKKAVEVALMQGLSTAH